MLYEVITQAVVRIAGKPHVYVVDNEKTVAREIELGLDNNRMAHIISGLTPWILISQRLVFYTLQRSTEFLQPKKLLNIFNLKMDRNNFV